MSSQLTKVVCACVAFSVLCILPLAACGAVIEIGTIDLLPNAPGQVVTLQVSGGELVAGALLSAQVADGGPELLALGLGEGVDGPAITGVDLESGIFLSNHLPQLDKGSYPQLAIWDISTASGAVAANGAFVTLTFDTTGFDSGEWKFSLLDTWNGPTLLLDVTGAAINLSETDGLLRVVPIPEPASLLLVLSGLGIAGLVWFRRRRAS